MDTIVNFLSATLGASALSGATSLTLTTGHGSRFGSTFPYDVVIYDSAYSNAALAFHAGAAEVVRVNSRSGDTLTSVTRAQQSTTALALGSGWIIIQAPTSGLMSQLIPESLLTTRGDTIRRGASASERLALIATRGAWLMSDGTDPIWATDGTHIHWTDEMIYGAVSKITWDIGGTGVVSTEPAESGRHGIVSLGCGSGATNVYYLRTGFTSIYPTSGDVHYWETGMRLNASPNGTDDYIARIGFGDGSTANFIDGIYFEIDRTISTTNWQAAVSKGSSRTKTDTAVAFGTSWVKLGILYTPATTEAKFYINGTEVRNETGANVPNTSSNLFGMVLQITGVAGTNTARKFLVDYVSWVCLLNSAR